MLSEEDFKREINYNLVVHPLNEACVTPVGYDIRLGFAFRISSGSTKSGSANPTGFRSPDSYLILEPDELLFIETLEFVWFSSAIAATCHVKGSLGTKGLVLCNPSTVDPFWKGALVFVLKNIGIFPIRIDYAIPIITLVIHKFDSESRVQPTTRVRSVTDFYDQHGVLNLTSELSQFENDRYDDQRRFDQLVQEAVSRRNEQAL